MSQVLGGLFSVPQVSSIDFCSTLEVYKRDCVVHSPDLPAGIKEPLPESTKKRGKINSFSQKSKRRAVFIANNSHGLNSQFLCTYHNIPTDGKLVKQHLNNFLTSLRHYFEDVKYFWFLEFQSRGSAHFHVFLNIEPTEINRLKIADFWLLASDQDRDIAAINFHQHHDNFFNWDLSGPYVAKYGVKGEQKDIPPFFVDIGRFWGSSRGIVPLVATAELPPELGRFLKNLLLSRITRKGKIPYKKYTVMKKLRKFTITIDDTILEYLLTRSTTLCIPKFIHGVRDFLDTPF